MLLWTCSLIAETQDGMKIYYQKNLLRNGNFQKKALNRNAPAYWCPNDLNWIDLPQHMSCYSLNNGVQSIKSPAPGLLQWIDIAPISAWNYELSFESDITSGILACSVGKWLSKNLKANKKGFVQHRFRFKLDPKIVAATLRIRFQLLGKNTSIKLRNIVLTPIHPKNKEDIEQIFIKLDKNKQYLLRGITVVNGSSDFEHFYNLKAAQYLQKYLYISFGQIINIYTADREAIKKTNGMICFGNTLINNVSMAKVTSGGYILEQSGNNIYVGGKGDGAVQGTLAILETIGMTFFASKNDFIPASRNIIKLQNSTIIRNPSFAYRGISNRGRQTPANFSCEEMYASGRRIGQWCSASHNNGILIDPFIYFKDHPEYYALGKNGQRSWRRSQLATMCGAKVTDNMTKKDIGDFRMTMNLCWSNHDVQKLAIKTILKWLALCPETKYISILQGDGSDPSDWCQCDNCKKFGVTCTDKYIRFINIIARAIKKKYPDTRIRAAAYCITIEPPVNITPESNVIVVYCVCGKLWGKNGGITETYILGSGCLPGINNFARWLKTGTSLGCTLYFPSLYEAVNKMRFFGSLGANAYFLAFPREDLLTKYIMGKLAWDLSEDVDPLIERFTAFYYGSGAPFMCRYLHLTEDKRVSYGRHANYQGNLGTNHIPLIVDDEILVKCKQLLDKTEKLVKRKDGKLMIKTEKLRFLNSYFLQKTSCGLEGEKLARFANYLAETLKLAKELRSRKPHLSMTYREMIWAATGIEIGNSNPWYKSLVLQELLDNPLKIIKASKKETYEKTQNGLLFNMKAFLGGKNSLAYQWQGIPKRKRKFAKSIKRASSPQSKISTVFKLNTVPNKNGILFLEGLDDEKTGRAKFKVLVNGKIIFNGVNTFGEKDWTLMQIKVPISVLQKGINSLEIINTTPEKTAAVADIYGRNYFWGWLMIANAKLSFKGRENPVVGKKNHIPDSWKKARVDIFCKKEEGAKLTPVKYENLSRYFSSTRIWCQSNKPLSDEWRELKFTAVSQHNTKLNLSLNGPYRPVEGGSKILIPIWIAYDDIKIEGAEIKNGNFEKLNDQGIPENWICRSKNVLTDNGENYIKASFERPVKQIIYIKGGKPITITMKVKRISE